MKIMVIPDVHGRKFWESAVECINDCDKVVFLGDYLDPYGFEDISVVSAIKNFNQIIEFAKEHSNKVSLLLGNHDMPYFSEEYLGLSDYHCRWSREWHDVISSMFEANRSLFKIACVEDGVLFTHAGCTTMWFKCLHLKPGECESIHDLETKLNDLLSSNEGMALLHMVSHHRGGCDDAGSCIWAHVVEVMNDYKGLQFADCKEVKQVFGHTLQVDYDEIGNIVSGDPIETPIAKMLDNRSTYILDTATFTATPQPL